MIQMAGMSEEDMQRAARSGNLPIKPSKPKKGKGKNKGGFRF